MSRSHPISGFLLKTLLQNSHARTPDASTAVQRQKSQQGEAVTVERTPTLPCELLLLYKDSVQRESSFSHLETDPCQPSMQRVMLEHSIRPQYRLHPPYSVLLCFFKNVRTLWEYVMCQTFVQGTPLCCEFSCATSRKQKSVEVGMKQEETYWLCQELKLGKVLQRTEKTALMLVNGRQSERKYTVGKSSR